MWFSSKPLVKSEAYSTCKSCAYLRCGYFCDKHWVSIAPDQEKIPCEKHDFIDRCRTVFCVDCEHVYVTENIDGVKHGCKKFLHLVTKQPLPCIDIRSQNCDRVGFLYKECSKS